MDMLPYKALHAARDIVDVMDQTTREIYQQKKRALANGSDTLEAEVGQGKDIMAKLSKLLCYYHAAYMLLIRGIPSPVQYNMSVAKEDSMSDSELLGQMSCV